MSATLEPPATSAGDELLPDGQSGPDLSVLQDRMPEGLKLSWNAVILVFLTCLIYYGFSVGWWFRLYHTDIWGHMSYGRWIVEHRQVPSFEPLMPLCEGVPFVDTAWLSQVIGYLVGQQYGQQGLLFLYSICIAASSGLLMLMTQRRTGVLWATLAAVVFCMWAQYQQLLVARPQLAGQVCFMLVFALITANRWRGWYMLVIPALFALWSNLHGSWPMGLCLLSAFCVGKAFDILRRTGSCRAMFRSWETRRLCLLTELCAAAVLLNPYGLRVYAEVLSISRNQNVADLLDWQPLTIQMKQGQACLSLVLALVFLYRFSPRRISMSEVIALTGFGLGTLGMSRMIIWFAPVAAYYLALHLAALVRSWNGTWPAVPERRGLRTVVAVGLVWIAFAFSPFGLRVKIGPEKNPEKARSSFENAVSSLTPIKAADNLLATPPLGMVYASLEYGDYLLWAGPPGIQLMVTSHAHLIPSEVWDDYWLIARAGRNWEKRLDHYQINTLVLRPDIHQELVSGMNELWESKVWTRVITPGKWVIYRRVKTL